MSEHLLHVTTEDAWAQAQSAGELRPESLESVGFIHLCKPEQLGGVLERFFSGQTGLLKLEVDPSVFTDPLRWEAADGDRFPHLYGPLPVAAVRAVTPLSPE